MAFSLAILLLLALVGLQSHGQILNESRVVTFPSQSRQIPRDFLATASGFIEVSSLESGCGSFDQLQVVSLQVASRLAPTLKAWTQKFPCGTEETRLLTSVALPSSAVSPSTGDILVLSYDSQGVYLSSVNKDGITNVTSLPHSFFSNHASILPFDDGTILLMNEQSLQTLDGNVLLQPPASGKFWGATLIEGAIFILQTNSTGASSVVKASYSTGAGLGSLQTVQVPITIAGSKKPFSFNQDVTAFDFINRRPLLSCAGELRVVIVQALSPPTLYEIIAFDSSLGFMGSNKRDMSPTQESLVDVTCDDHVGRSFALSWMVTISSSSTITSEFMIYQYNSTLGYDGSFSPTLGYTTNSDVSYVKLIGSPFGNIYAHRETTLDLATNTELLEVVYTACSSSEFGPGCSNCTCRFGTCDAGESGSGLCTDCLTDRIAGVNCQINCACITSSIPCDNGIAGDGHCVCPTHSFGSDCSECDSGYFLNDQLACEVCPQDNYCVNSTKLPCQGNGVVGQSVCVIPTGAPTPSPTNAPTTTAAPTTLPTDPNSSGQINKFDWIPIIIGIVFAALAVFAVGYGSWFYRHYFKEPASYNQPLEDIS